jgi:hypothetical protein
MKPSIAATVLLAAVLAAGCATGTTPTLSVGGTPPRPRHTCPAALPKTTSPFPDWTDLNEPDSTLVPGSPTGAQACRYEHLNDPKPGTLARTATLNATQATRLAGAFDQARRASGGVYNCPTDVAAFDLVVFDYADGSQAAVLASLSGCRGFTNGKYTTGPSDAADTQLVTYVGSPAPLGG